jgi:Rad3-related DNA helicase
MFIQQSKRGCGGFMKTDRCPKNGDLKCGETCKGCPYYKIETSFKKREFKPVFKCDLKNKSKEVAEKI